MPQFLLACFSEEIPARMQRGAREQLARLFTRELEKSGLPTRAISTYASPRHLAISIGELPAEIADTLEEKKGPKVGAPEAAIAGFLKSTGLTLEQCEQRQVGKDLVYFANVVKKGGSTSALLKTISETVLSEFTWPKSMRWGAHNMRWVRPLHALTALFDSEVIPVKFGHLTASNVTHGHRFLAPDAITLAHANDYVGALEKAHVLVDAETRKETIRTQLLAAAKSANLHVVEDDALLEEVTGLVEWPTVLVGSFDAEFLSLPPEVLVSEMKHHQRYFALKDAAGTLTNQFLITSNMITSDGGTQVIAGNSRVLRARLSDGAFYWEQDRKVSLETWGKKLADVVFHAKVGMMDAKVARIEALALQIADAVAPTLDKELVKRAAKLCKADLTSGMVGEFPELQGIMGRYYAKAQGEPEAIAEAIYEHYKPQGAGDDVPQTELGAILSIADKLDSIISLFAAGEKPTGSKDPLALRRAALGIQRICIALNWHLDLRMFVRDKKLQQEIITFFADRLSNQMREQGLRHDVVDAVLAAQTIKFIPAQLSIEMHDFQHWLQTSNGTAALAAIKRAMNMIAKADASSFIPISSIVQTQLEQIHIRNLYVELTNKCQRLNDGCFFLADLEELAPYVNAFCNNVLVNAEEPEARIARLSLLAGVREAANTIADFSKIEG